MISGCSIDIWDIPWYNVSVLTAEVIVLEILIVAAVFVGLVIICSIPIAISQSRRAYDWDKQIKNDGFIITRSAGAFKVDDKNIEIDKSSLIELNEFLKKELEMEAGDCVIITGSVPQLMSGQSTNFMKIHKIS